jgi:hypothetical protein
MAVSLEVVVKQMLIAKSGATRHGDGRKYKTEQNAGKGFTASPRSCS